MDQNDATAIPGDFLDFILINATRFGGVNEYDKVKKLLENPPSPQHKLACIRALCAAEDAALIERTFSLLHSDEVKMQDVRYFMTGLAANRHTRRQLWQDFQKDLPNIVAKFTGSYIFSNIIQASFNRFSSDEDLAAIVEFFKDKDTKEYDQALNQALDAVRAKAAWLKRDSRDVEDWLKQNSELDSAFPLDLPIDASFGEQATLLDHRPEPGWELH
jgi:aminopeptidase 2